MIYEMYEVIDTVSPKRVSKFEITSQAPQSIARTDALVVAGRFVLFFESKTLTQLLCFERTPNTLLSI